MSGDAGQLQQRRRRWHRRAARRRARAAKRGNPLPSRDFAHLTRPSGTGRSGSRRSGPSDEVGVLLAELGPQAPDVDVDGAGAAVVLVAPHPRQQRLAGEHLAGVRGEELEQLVLHVGEVERVAVDGGLVGLEVEHERRRTRRSSGAVPRPGAPEQVPEPGLELAGVERRQAEVVEQVVAQLEVAELGAADQQQQRLERDVALAQRAGTGRTRPRGRRRRTTIGAGPAVVGLEAGAATSRRRTAFHGVAAAGRAPGASSGGGGSG